MAGALGWWTLETTTELEDHDREHIAEQIRQGFTEGQIVPSLSEDDWTDTTDGEPVESDTQHVADQDGPCWTRRFTRRRADGDYDVVEISTYGLGQDRDDRIGRATLYAICSDPRTPSASSSWEHTWHDEVPAHGRDAEELCADFDDDNINWDGTPPAHTEWM